jgi:hypothetical protein
MQEAIAVAASLLASGVAVAQPANVNVRVIVSGDIRPGLYGRVDFVVPDEYKPKKKKKEKKDKD